MFMKYARGPIFMWMPSRLMASTESVRKRMGIDLLSVSGHKIHDQRGRVFSMCGRGVKLFPYIYGGGQQRGFRSGTDNVPGAAGLGEAAACVYKNLEENEKHMRRLKLRLAEGIRKLDQTVIHGGDPGGCAHIVDTSGGEKRSTSAHAGGTRNLYFCRKCLLQP